MKILTPISAVFTWISSGIQKLFFKRSSAEPSVTEEDLTDLIESFKDEREEDEETETETARLMVSALHFGARTARDSMTAWENVETLDTSMELSEIYSRVQQTNHSRFPMLNSKGKVMGVMNIRAFLKAKPIPPPSRSGSLEFGRDEVPARFDPALASAWKNRLEACISGLNLCDRVIGVSEDVRRILVKYGVAPDRILVQHIGSAIAEKTIPHTRAVDPADVVFGFIGGVGFYKGVHQLVKAYAGLPASLKERSRLEIFGKYEQPYVDAVTQAYLNDGADRRRVTFHGRFSPDDIPAITNQIDISVLPSLCADTAPQTIFESFNAGLPIIAPRVGGFPDFVIDGENGLLYPAGDVDGLRKCLATVLGDVSLIGRFRDRIPKTKTMPENVRELLALYDSLR